jgi:hypothetical protein
MPIHSSLPSVRATSPRDPANPAQTVLLPNENIPPTAGISAEPSEEIFRYRTGFVTKFGPQICLLPVPIFGVKINHIQESCGKGVVNTPTIIYDDNAACVAQMHMGYVKSNLTKHIAPKFFYPHELQKSGKIKILQARSCGNLVDLFTKSLLASSFNKCIYGIGMRRLRDLQGLGGDSP